MIVGRITKEATIDADSGNYRFSFPELPRALWVMSRIRTRGSWQRHFWFGVRTSPRVDGERPEEFPTGLKIRSIGEPTDRSLITFLLMLS